MEEKELLAELKECGFDFRSPLEALALRFPPKPEAGDPAMWVIPVRLEKEWAGCGFDWQVRWPEEWERSKPARTYSTSWAVEGPLEACFEELRHGLQEPLGEGELGQIGSGHAASWRVGIINIQLMVWQRRREKARARVWVSVPWGGVEAKEASECGGRRLLTGARLQEERCFYSQRIKAREGGPQCCVEADVVRLLYQDFENRVPRANLKAVEWGVAYPARGGGYEEVALLCEVAGGKQCRVRVLGEPGAPNLGDAAAELAEALGVERKTSSWPDE